MKEIEKLIIAGGRDYTDYGRLKNMTVSFLRFLPIFTFNSPIILSGNAPGADRLGEDFAAETELPVKFFPADWTTHGKAAGPIRNADMAKEADAAIIFWDGKSKGSKDMIGKALKKRIPTRIVYPSGSITYLISDATRPAGTGGDKIIAHIVNDVPAWGKGFVLSVSHKWPMAKESYLSWSESKSFVLGEVQFCGVEMRLSVANMLAQHGLYAEDGRIPLRIDALQSCLRKVADQAVKQSATVHMPRIGCGLAGGKWEDIEPLIVTNLCGAGVDVFVYDLQ